MQCRLEVAAELQQQWRRISQSINHLFVKASKMTVTKVSAQDQQGSESAYSNPKTKPKYVKTRSSAIAEGPRDASCQ